MTIARARRSVIVAAVSAALTLGVTSCSSSSDAADVAASSPATSPDALVAAADPSLVPYNFLDDDGATWKGLNVELAAALGEKLGRTITFENVAFDSIIPGLTSGRYDLALTGMFDTKEREKQVDFVDYITSKNNFLMKSSFTKDVQGFDDLCGVTVGIPSGALEGQYLDEASKKCVSGGQQKITVNEYKDLSATLLALTSDRIEVTPNDSAANAYAMTQQQGLKVTGGYATDGYFAAAFPKNSALTQEVRDAFAAIIKDGTYRRILETWGVADRGLDEPLINSANF
ncbi:ABC transporter substrate-binding protein [Acrocarpospora catenulata]|uniref:ABC transporter substrate-binding protein n=1 Tax=Acrocarpospora catenulata TaxID=2836182 RepID=UPI001BDAA63A|nr:ABC transporter substrate-binding protein [Acrocarpospora catenulata]